ncbi:MAG: 3-deoxy-D-manno-octulosonic acid transferase [Muribaculaceae bacterium]|nr:3-deoxy-D-manno-octulosonic acid transferase [Muribaculaceae bacterium]
MNPLYNTAIQLYRAGASLAALRSDKVREMLRGQEETLRTLEECRAAVAPEGYDVWIHAASLGEFEQGRPIIERLRRERPGISILLTFFSPSGYRVRRDYKGADTVAYLPMDTRANVRRFLDAAAPRCAIFIKYEFWGNFLTELQRRAIPTYIISAIFRPSQVFFKPWGGLFRRMLRCFDHIYVQDARSARLLKDIGIDKVTVAGDTRFDRVADICRAAREVPVIERFSSGAPFTLVAGSSWPADEALYISWLKAHPDVRAIIAPHEFDDSRLRTLRRNLGPQARLLSEVASPDDLDGSERYIIVDSFGLLSSLYRYGTAAWVGGGFGAGIHNINEAAAWGIPVIFGPRHEKFKEASDLLANDAATQVNSQRDTTKALDSLLQSADARNSAGQAARQYIDANIGATDIIFNDIFPSSDD